MTVTLLTEQHLKFLSIKRGCTGSSESILVIMLHCWKSHVTTQFILFNQLCKYALEMITVLLNVALLKAVNGGTFCVSI